MRNESQGRDWWVRLVIINTYNKHNNIYILSLSASAVVTTATRNATTQEESHRDQGVEEPTLTVAIERRVLRGIRFHSQDLCREIFAISGMHLRFGVTETAITLFNALCSSEEKFIR